VKLTFENIVYEVKI